MSIEEFESFSVGVGALITALFSFLIWRANKESAKAARGAADAAKESAKISDLMLKAQSEQNKSIRDQLRRVINKRNSDAVDILSIMVTDKASTDVFSRLPESIGISNFELASHFTEKEQQLVYYTAEKYDIFRMKYFPAGHPKYSINQEFISDCDELIDEMKDVVIELTDKIEFKTTMTLS